MHWSLNVAALACFSVIGFAQDEPAQDEPAVFGTTVVIPSGLHGSVYHIHHRPLSLHDFEKMKPVGTIYTSAINVPPQDFKQGFPGVTKRFEWFAIDYTGKFWIDNPGPYTFSLLSDDGAWLFIDDGLIIDNGGLHPPEEKSARVELTGGIHNLRLAYFQGIRWQVALVLKIAGVGEQLRVFSTDEFKPPPNPESWKFPDRTNPDLKAGQRP